MDLTQKRNNSVKTFFLCIIIFFMCCPIFIGGSTMKKASAETATGTPTLQEIVDNTVFITFSKGEDEKYGKNIFSCFYVPDAYYDTSLEYGVIVFPRWFSEKYGITGNYIEEYTAIGMGDALSIMVVNKPSSVNNGKILRCGIINIPEQGVNIELSFIFFVRDSEGNIAYESPRHGAYAALLVEDYTDEDLIEMIGLRVETENSFRKIIDKIVELVDSVWVYVVLAFASIVVVWGAFIGIKIVIAKKNEEKIDARGMVKNLIIGIVVMFVIAVCCPLLINGLSSWLSW